MHHFPQIISFFQNPPCWVVGSAVVPEYQVDIAAMSEVVFTRALPKSGLTVQATRDGEFSIDFSKWPQGVLPPTIRDTSGDPPPKYHEVMGARTLVLNAFLCCFQSVGADSGCYPRLGRITSQDLAQRMSFNAVAGCAGRAYNRLRSARATGTYHSKLPPALDERIADRVVTYSLEHLRTAVSLADEVVSRGQLCVRRVALTFQSLQAQSTNEFTESLILSWSVIESLVAERWATLKNTHNFSGQASKSIYSRLEDLRGAGGLREEVVQDCQFLRGERNGVIHKLQEVTPEVSQRSLFTLGSLLDTVAGLQLSLPKWAGRGGWSVSWLS